jgi:uncharacterized protein HemY
VRVIALVTIFAIVIVVLRVLDVGYAKQGGYREGTKPVRAEKAQQAAEE